VASISARGGSRPRNRRPRGKVVKRGQRAAWGHGEEGAGAVGTGGAGYPVEVPVGALNQRGLGARAVGASWGDLAKGSEAS
jgi:hypothetical protein